MWLVQKDTEQKSHDATKELNEDMEKVMLIEMRS